MSVSSLVPAPAAPRACGVASSARAAGASGWVVAPSGRAYSGRVLRATFRCRLAAARFAHRWSAQLPPAAFSRYPFIQVRPAPAGRFVVSVPVAALRA